jgi:hypothetical protein
MELIKFLLQVLQAALEEAQRQISLVTEEDEQVPLFLKDKTCVL